MNFLKQKNKVIFRLTGVLTVMVFIFTGLIAPVSSVWAQTAALNLPAPGSMVLTTPAFTPLLLKGLTINPQEPFKFNFIVDTGNDDIDDDALKAQGEKLINYFLASLTVPEKKLWVNLSPHEPGRIIADGLSQTEMGRDLLAQDYLLKQLTASLIYPEDDLGAAFWKRVYAQAHDLYGITDIPVNTFNKVWVLPDQAAVYVKDNHVFVVEAKLKVMLEEDFLKKNVNGKSLMVNREKIKNTPFTINDSRLTDVMREIILPEIEREVNHGQNFAPLRQIYHSMILALWYKRHLKNSLLNQKYTDQNKTTGIELDDLDIKQRIYDQYMAAFTQGVFNYIGEDYDPYTDETVPRKYFSGGWHVPEGFDVRQTAYVSAGQLRAAGRYAEIEGAYTRAGKDGSHEDRHEKSGFAQYIQDALQSGAVVRRGQEKKAGPLNDVTDLRLVLDTGETLTHAHGRITRTDRDTLVIVDDRFTGDHVGRTRRAVYVSAKDRTKAQVESKVAHEIQELEDWEEAMRVWSDFAYTDLGMKETQIKGLIDHEQLLAAILAWANDQTVDATELVRRQNQVIAQSRILHAHSLRSEADALEQRGRTNDAAAKRAEADDVLSHIPQVDTPIEDFDFFIAGEGNLNTGQPVTGSTIDALKQSALDGSQEAVDQLADIILSGNVNSPSAMDAIEYLVRTQQGSSARIVIYNLLKEDLSDLEKTKRNRSLISASTVKALAEAEEKFSRFPVDRSDQTLPLKLLSTIAETIPRLKADAMGVFEDRIMKGDLNTLMMMNTQVPFVMAYRSETVTALESAPPLYQSLSSQLLGDLSQVRPDLITKNTIDVLKKRHAQGDESALSALGVIMNKTKFDTQIITLMEDELLHNGKESNNAITAFLLGTDSLSNTHQDFSSGESTVEKKIRIFSERTVRALEHVMRINKEKLEEEYQKEMARKEKYPNGVRGDLLAQTALSRLCRIYALLAQYRPDLITEDSIELIEEVVSLDVIDADINQSKREKIVKKRVKGRASTQVLPTLLQIAEVKQDQARMYRFMKKLIREGHEGAFFVMAETISGPEQTPSQKDYDSKKIDWNAMAQAAGETLGGLIAVLGTHVRERIKANSREPEENDTEELKVERERTRELSRVAQALMWTLGGNYLQLAPLIVRTFIRLQEEAVGAGLDPSQDPLLSSSTYMPIFDRIKERMKKDKEAVKFKDIEPILQEDLFKWNDYDKRELLRQILVPMFFSNPEDLTLPLFNDIVSVFQDVKFLRYFLFYVSTRDRAPPEVKAEAERILSQAEDVFPLHEQVRRRLAEGEVNMLVVHNIRDGQGDELIRMHTFIQALLDYNSKLNVTIVTDRSYLYDHPRARVIDISDTYRVEDVLKGKYDVVVDHYDISQRYNDGLEKRFQETLEKEQQKDRKFLYVKTNKSNDHFVFETVEVEGGDMSSSLELNIVQESNVYGPVFRLLAELGIPFRAGQENSKEGNLCVAVPYEKARQEWTDMMRKIDNYDEATRHTKKPVVIVNPFGGETERKGYAVQSSVKESRDLRRQIHTLVESGYKVVILPNGTPWGTRGLTEDVIADMTMKDRESIIIGPDPRDDPRFFKYFVSYADHLMTVEGGMMHLGYLLGKPMGIVLKHGAGPAKWIPYGIDNNQEVIAGADDVVGRNRRRTAEKAPEEQVGGIDLDPAQLDLRVEGATPLFDLAPDDPEFLNIEINGLIPVIFTITPIADLPMLLGVKREDEETFELSRKVSL